MLADRNREGWEGKCVIEQLRVSVLLQDYSFERPIYMGSWHLLLPSDVTLCLHKSWV